MKKKPNIYEGNAWDVIAEIREQEKSFQWHEYPPLVMGRNVQTCR